jgi:hypothetical protein
MNALNPPSLGTGGGGGGFNSNQQAVIGIQPNSGGTVATASIALNDYVNLSASTIGYYNPFSVSTNVINSGTTTFNGDFCAAAFDATTGTFICFVDSVMTTSLPVGYTFTSGLTFSTTGLIALLPGSYVIGVYYRVAGGSWVAVSNAGAYTNFEPLDVVNHNYMELTAAMSPTPATFVQGAAGSVTLNLGNYGSLPFSGSLDVSLYNFDGSLACTIQTMTGMSLAAGYIYTTPLTFSTSSITAPPGTYFLATMYDDGGGWALAGADYHTNPVYINVVEPPPSPDIYEVNNTSATAYNLPLTFTSNVATKSTTGSNIHAGSDEDYYKIVLPSGYGYTITARVNDQLSSDDAVSYTNDVVWSYSTDGSTWSPAYNDVMTGAISIPGVSGGTVIFHVSAAFPGSLGSYLLKMTVNRTPVGVANINAEQVSIFPNPASESITIDFTGSNIHGIDATLTDILGRKVYHDGMISGQDLIKIPVSGFATGLYTLSILTDAGMLTRKITVGK